MLDGGSVVFLLKEPKRNVGRSKHEKSLAYLKSVPVLKKEYFEARQLTGRMIEARVPSWITLFKLPRSIFSLSLLLK